MRHPTPNAIWRGQLPSVIDAEKALLGTALLMAALPPNVAVMPQDFYQPVHEAIWKAVLSLDADGKRPDEVAVSAWLEAHGEGHKIKAVGQAYFGELLTLATIPDIAPHHANLIAAAAQQRRVIAAASAIPSVVVAAEDGWQAEVERLLLEATESRGGTRSVRLREILRTVTSSLEARYKSKSVVTGVPSGFAEIDAMTSGFQPCDLVVIAARPSMGKTSLAMNAVAHALGCGTPALVFSLEMSKESLTERLVSSDSQTALSSMRTGLLSSRDWMALTNSMSRLSGLPLWIDDDAGMSLSDLRRRARLWAAQPDVKEAGSGIIVIDYLQLMSTDGIKADTRDREVAAISRGIKALARELRVPVLALSQLNRSCESRADKRPTLADLRDSGAIEQDADLICFIYRDEVYDKDSKHKGIAEILIAKQRNGPTGTVLLGWDPMFTRFYTRAT